MLKRSIHIVSSLHGSIGEITKDLIKGLSEEFDITVEGQDIPKEYHILLCHFIQPQLLDEELFRKFKHRVLIQPIDGTSIKRDFIACFNEFDLIITPAQAGQTIMLNNGVETPIVVIPNFYKEEQLDLSRITCSIKQIPDDKFVFYHESTFHPRKGIELLYEGYIRAFSDTTDAERVLLVVKDLPYNKLTFDRIESLKREMMKLQKIFAYPARIIKISQILEWNTLQQLWKRADAYVSLAKIEGFGIPLLRFAYLGKPIITLDNPNSGYTDFLNSNNSYIIPTEQIIAHNEHMQLYTDQTLWASPSVEDITKAFRDCYHAQQQKYVDRQSINHLEYKNVLERYINLLKILD